MKVAVITAEYVNKLKEYSGIELSVFHWTAEDASTINLRDFDGVIVDADSLKKLKDWPNIGFEQDVFSPEVVYAVLHEKNSFFVILGKPTTPLENVTLADRLGFLVEEVEGKGSSIKRNEMSKTTVYASYLRKINTYEYSFYDTVHLNDYYSNTFARAVSTQATVSITNLLLTRASHRIAFTVMPKVRTYDTNGAYGEDSLFDSPLVFLPTLPGGSLASIESILEIHSAHNAPQVVAPPDWTEDIQTEGQAKIDKELQSIKNTIATQQIKLSETLLKRATVRKSIEILYLAERPLENALKVSFESLGFEVRDPDNSNHVEFYLQNGNHEFVIEVKSTKKKTFNKDGLRQVKEWQDNEALDTGKDYKPLLILSNEYLIEPNERNTKFIDEHLTTFAQSRGVAVISVLVLFEALQMIDAKRATKDCLSKLLFESSGVITKEMISSMTNKLR